MTEDAILVAGLILSTYLATGHARGARLLIRVARWPTADRAELWTLTRAYIAGAVAYALAATLMLAALAARHM